MCKVFLLVFILSISANAQVPFTTVEKVVFGCKTEDLKSFERFAARAKESGATHMAIQAEDLPLAYWEMQPENDPYPAWVITNPGLLKINPPQLLQPFIPEEYGKSVMEIIDARCGILEKLGLKAAFHTFEPQMLPEAFFESYPHLRGPQVDNPMRSRLERYAPSMSEPVILEMYREAIAELKKKCPCLDILEFRTNDSGAGIEWSEALYAGANGRSNYRSQSMDERIHRFLQNLQTGRQDEPMISDVHIYNTKEPQKEHIAEQLNRGLAIDHLEGPDGSRFKSQVGSLLYYRKAFAPVPGIPDPIGFIEGLQAAANSEAPRLFVMLGDNENQDLYFELYDEFRKQPCRTPLEKFKLLDRVASTQVGDEASALLTQAWTHLQKASQWSSVLSSGGSLFIVGSVHQRWLTRPFVPFPERMTEEEKAYYRKHQFQARTEADANDLLDIQGSQFINGINGFRLSNRILSRINREVAQADKNLLQIEKMTTNEQARVLRVRLKVYRLLIKNVRNALHYQVILDRARTLENDTDPPYPFVGPEDFWSQQELMRIARDEMDNTVTILEMLEEYRFPLLDQAKSDQEEYQRLLGPDLVPQLKQKIRLMRKYWPDYKEIQKN